MIRCRAPGALRRLLVLFASSSLACAATGPHGPEAPVVPVAMAFEEPREPGRRYRAECTERRDGPGTETATIELSLVAEDEETSAVHWRRVVHSIWGRYGRADCVEVDRLWLATPGSAADRTRMLVARTTHGAWYVLDPRDGRPMREALWAKLGGLPVLASPLTLMGVERIGIAAMPGHAFLIHVRNDGPPLLVESSHRHVALEAATGSGPWQRVADDPFAEDVLGVVSHGAELEVSVSAHSAGALRSAAGRRVRLVLIAYPLGAAGLPTAPVRVLLAIPPKDVAALTRR